MALNKNTPVELENEAAENKVVAEFIIGEDGKISSEAKEGKTTVVTVTEDGTVTTETIDNTASEEIEIFFEPMNFVDNLSYMGKGMLGIFSVIGIIIVSVYLLAKIGVKKDEQ